MTYTDKDTDRARQALTEMGYRPEGLIVKSVAQLTADVRRETIEECARVCDDAEREWGKEAPPRSYETAWSMTVVQALRDRIRALLDEPEADYDPTRSPIVPGDFNGPHGAITPKWKCGWCRDGLNAPECLVCGRGNREPEEHMDATAAGEARVKDLEIKLAAWEAARDRELIRRTELQDTLTEVKERLQAILKALE